MRGSSKWKCTYSTRWKSSNEYSLAIQVCIYLCIMPCFLPSFKKEWRLKREWEKLLEGSRRWDWKQEGSKSVTILPNNLFTHSHLVNLLPYNFSHLQPVATIPSCISASQPPMSRRHRSNSPLSALLPVNTAEEVGTGSFTLFVFMRVSPSALRMLISGCSHACGQRPRLAASKMKAFTDAHWSKCAKYCKRTRIQGRFAMKPYETMNISILIAWHGILTSLLFHSLILTAKQRQFYR